MWKVRTYAEMCFHGRSGNEVIPEGRACSPAFSVVLATKGCSQLWKTFLCSNTTLLLKEDFWTQNTHKNSSPNLFAHVGHRHHYSPLISTISVINITILFLFLATFCKNDINTKKQ